jgi:hypothetical protein
VAEAGPMPIPLASLLATTRATFAARRSVHSHRLEPVAPEDREPAFPHDLPMDGEEVPGGSVFAPPVDTNGDSSG